MHHPLESLAVTATAQQKVESVLGLAELKSVKRVQREFRLVHGGPAPSYNSIKKWDRHLRESGSVVNYKSPGRPRIFKEGEHIRQGSLRTLRKSNCTTSRQLHLPHSTVQGTVHKRLRANKLQLRQYIKPAGRDRRKRIYESILQKVDSVESFHGLWAFMMNIHSV
jgi:hypothetical protein